jgi:MarR family 2-MHQ and catechol resistance regulon transcriptional repressor
MCETASRCAKKLLYYHKIEEMAKIDSRSSEPSGTKAFTAVWKAYRALLARSEESKKKTGLCESDFRVLEALLQSGPQRVNVIGTQIDLTTGSITTAIDRLESRWLAVRRLDPNDRRVRLVELTSKGRRVIERVSVEHTKSMENAFRQLSRDQQLQLIKLLERVTTTSPRQVIRLVGSTRRVRKAVRTP